MKIGIFNFLMPVLALLVTGLPGTLSGNTIYIMYDARCMDRIEYSYINKEDGSTYIAYQIEIATGTKIVLDIGKESTSEVTSLPAQYVECGSRIFDQRMVEAINRNYDQVYVIVQGSSRKYAISKVNSAAFFQVSNQVLTYLEEEYKFRFDLIDGTIGEDISYNNPGAKIYFEGKMENECSGLYLFRQRATKNGVPSLIDLVLAPEVGIVEERSGASVEEALNNTLRLDRVNGTRLDRYMQRLCSDQPIREEQFTTQSAVQPLQYEPSQPQNQPASDGKKSPGEISTKYHDVKKGETLYSIAKKYGVSVGQLKNWNGKGTSNLIRVGERLQVSQAQEAAASSRQQTNFAASSNVMPAPYEQSGVTARGGQNLVSSRSAQSWNTTDGYHQVKPGETVASIAMKYGFTEARFRDLNNLDSNDFPKIGQILKTVDCSNCPQSGTSSSTTGYDQYVPSYSRTNNRTNVTSYSSGGYTQKEVSDRFTKKSGFSQTSSSRNDELIIGNTPQFSSPTPQNYSTQSTVNPELPDYKYRPMERSLDSTYPSSYESNISTSRNGSRTVHVVKEGESLYGIARKYNVPVEKIREMNNLEANEIIIPYQRLYVK